MNKHKRTRAARRRARRRSESRSKSIAQASSILIGDPSLDCACPVCAHYALEGEPVTYVDERGRVVERVPDLPEMMTVRFTPRGSLEIALGHAEQTLEVPVGCSADDFAEYVRFRFLPQSVPGLLAARPETAREREILLAGESVEVTLAPWVEEVPMAAN